MHVWAHDVVGRAEFVDIERFEMIQLGSFAFDDEDAVEYLSPFGAMRSDPPQDVFCLPHIDDQVLLEQEINATDMVMEDCSPSDRIRIEQAPVID